MPFPETDPTGRSAHQAGSKLDAGKPRMSLVLGGFADALTEVAKVGTYGANKYTDNGWQEVPNGIERYTDALMRHMLAEQMGEECDQDTELRHAAHLAWNALSRLSLILRRDNQRAIDELEARRERERYETGMMILGSRAQVHATLVREE